MTISPYTWLLLAGVIVSFLFWKKRARQDKRLVFIYGAALVGAFFGAKVIYLLAEGWLHFGAPDMWLQLAAGKSILGALLGGYVFVELAKRHVGYASTTGDDFALIAPISIGLGRAGCLLHGCCLGRGLFARLVRSQRRGRRPALARRSRRVSLQRIRVRSFSIPSTAETSAQPALPSLPDRVRSLSFCARVCARDAQNSRSVFRLPFRRPGRRVVWRHLFRAKENRFVGTRSKPL